MTLGARVRELRKKAGLTLEQLAAQAEASKSYIWDLENERLPKPSADKLTKIAEVLRVTTEYLTGADKAPSHETALMDSQDAAFFRKYRNLDDETKAKLRQILDIVGKT
jgi:transcriptional regulator with XRE-family HTH domain